LPRFGLVNSTGTLACPASGSSAFGPGAVESTEINQNKSTKIVA